MTIPYLICEFNQYTISNLVKESFGSDFPDVFSKNQVKYIFNYLKDLKAKSVLLEFDYVDKDYLEDYSRYYVRCFNNAGYRCTRLHFFQNEINHQTVESFLLNGIESSARNDLQSSYLGFVVIKPLPSTFIGRTCLKVYPKLISSQDRKCLARTYNVDLFGISLSVESVAFQEQDKILSACATTAIWSAIHGFESKSVRDVPACSEITTYAINHIQDSNNGFPNKELTNKQMLRALDVLGFRYHTEKVAPDSGSFFAIVKSYIDSKLPIILGGLVSEFSSSDESSGWHSLAGHAVTVLGYKDSEDGKAIYFHDDRLGPFARAVIAEDEVASDATAESGKFHLLLQLKDKDGVWLQPKQRLTPQTIIVPTDKKVRISPDLVRNTCELIIDIYRQDILPVAIKKALANSAILSEQDLPDFEIDFELSLAEISGVRKSLIENQKNTIEIFKKTRADYLRSSSARFHWVARFRVASSVAVEIFFDATDIPQGSVISGIVVYDEVGADFVEAFRNLALKQKSLDGYAQSQNLYSSFLKSLRKRSGDWLSYLDSKYGSPRAPKYIKPAEVTDDNPNYSETVKSYYEFSCDDIRELFHSYKSDKLIWAISYDGALLVDKEIEQRGHPTLTGFKPARISGEIMLSDNVVTINSKSGRYSGDYTKADKDFYLKNAVERMKRVFEFLGCKIEVDTGPEVLQ